MTKGKRARSLGGRFDAFISYRRREGAELAQLVRKFLASRGVRAFLDVKELGAGHFDSALLDVIAETPNFILILGRDSLKSCNEMGDWLAREILQAMRSSRNIIPLVSTDFAFPESNILPPEMDGIRRYQCAFYDHRFSDEALDKLVRMLQLERRPRGRRFLWLLPAVLLIGAIYLLIDHQGVFRPKPEAGSGIAAPAVAFQPAFAYSLLVQKYRDGKPFQAPFRLAKEIVFESDYQIRILFSGLRTGHLYIVNEGPQPENGLPDYNMLFPSSTANGGSSVIAAGQQVPIPEKSWLEFDQQAGAEKLWLVWSQKPLPSLEQAKSIANPRDRGDVNDRELTLAVRKILADHAEPPPEIIREEGGERTIVRTQKDVLVLPIVLEHQ